MLGYSKTEFENVKLEELLEKMKKELQNTAAETLQ